jgi:hypothetical protein
MHSNHGEVAIGVNEIIADSLSKTGWTLGYVLTLDCCRRTIWIADAHRDDGKRFVVHGG